MIHPYVAPHSLLFPAPFSFSFPTDANPPTTIDPRSGGVVALFGVSPKLGATSTHGFFSRIQHFWRRELSCSCFLLLKFFQKKNLQFRCVIKLFLFQPLLRVGF